MKLIRYAELAATPWKNGGGITRELACHPAGASMQDFVWRISIADVGQSGPFSSFPGIDRVITLLDGDGMQLQFADDSCHDLTDTLAPYAFRGEDQLHAQLIDRPSRDFNLMLRRDAAQGNVEVKRVSGTLNSNASALLLFCARGEWRADTRSIAQNDALLIELPSKEITLTALTEHSVMLCVSITLRAQAQ